MTDLAFFALAPPEMPSSTDSGTSQEVAPRLPAPPASINRAALQPTASVSFVPEQPREIVTRPDPGLARGKWEAPPWGIGTACGVMIVLALVYFARRMGYLRRKRS